jgi:hypothetical protein
VTRSSLTVLPDSSDAKSTLGIAERFEEAQRSWEEAIAAFEASGDLESTEVPGRDVDSGSTVNPSA